MEKNKVLYVDDEVVNLKLFEIIFRKKYNVIIAESGAQGLRILENTPDIPIVVSDMRMPEMSGIDFIKKAKAFYPDKIFFILTGFEITDEIQDAIESGIILQYFRKPLNKTEIETAIENVLKKIA